MPDEQAILPYARVEGDEHRGVLVCGCYERWVSIYLQSVRALNLAWALLDGGELGRGSRVCVVGGGFAGLALAAALGRGGAAVTLLERSPALLAAQRDNHVRWIHPHIHEWPRPGALEPRAGLPLLDWAAGRSAEVAAQILAGFERETAASRIAVHTGVGPVGLEPGPRVAWSGRPAAAFDAAILALGVGIEKSFGALPLRSYWSDESIAFIRPGPRRHHLVTGIGEGGVIDALYLRLAGFSHAEIAARLAALPGMRAVEQALLAVEDELAGLSDEVANAVLAPRYAALPVPAEVDALLAARARADTRVTLNGPEPRPLAARADVLNRFLISRLVAGGDLYYLPGKIVAIEAGDGAYSATLADGSVHLFDEVNIRHGTVPTLRSGFPAVWDRYAPARAALPHLTPRPSWPAGFFDR